MKYFETRLAIIIVALALAVSLVTSVNATEEEYVAELAASDVQFIYSTNGNVTLIKTEATAEAIDAFVAKAPTSVEVTVVVYSNTGNRKPGYELTNDEPATEEEE